MQSRHDYTGPTLLLLVTLIAIALQAIKLGSRLIVLEKWPTAGQWGQLAVVIWLLIELWEGKEWSRVVTMLFYVAASIVGVIVLCIMWPKAPTSMLVVSTFIVLLAATNALILGLSRSLRTYLAERRIIGSETQPDS